MSAQAGMPRPELPFNPDARRKKRRMPSLLWLLVLLTFFVLAGAFVMLGNQSITVARESITVVGLPRELEGFTILQLSDLNGARFGDYQSKLLATIGQQKYDAVLLTGDMVGPNGEAEPLYELVQGLAGRRPVFFVCGEADPAPLRASANAEDVFSPMIRRLRSMGAVYLDAPARLTVSGNTIWFSPEHQLFLDAPAALSGIEAKANELGERTDSDSVAAELNVIEAQRDAMQRLIDSLGQMRAQDVQIAVGHTPPSDALVRTLQSAPQMGRGWPRTPDLMVSGHYCGGQWRLPGLGALYVPAPDMERGGWFPSQDHVMGLHRVSGVNIYTCAGLGPSPAINLPPVRVLCPPQISLLRLTVNLQ